jgi:hypothetical protein
LQNAGKFSGSEWTLEDLVAIEHNCSRHAANYGLDTFPNQMEVITSEQMLDSYVSAGLPVNYAHWSFGKHYLRENAKYRSGQNSLAYEIAQPLAGDSLDRFRNRPVVRMDMVEELFARRIHRAPLREPLASVEQHQRLALHVHSRTISQTDETTRCFHRDPHDVHSRTIR